MFVSLSALCQEFGIDSGLSREEIAKELSHRRSKIHPDKMGGEFVSKHAKDNFHRLSEAIEYLAGTPTEIPQALAIRTEVQSLAKLVQTLQSTVDQINLDHAGEDSPTKTLRSEISVSHRRAEVGSVTLAAICGAVLVFSEKIATNPSLAPIASNDATKYLLGVVLLCTVVTFIATWVNEQRLVRVMDYVLSDDGISSILYWCLNSRGDSEKPPEITKRILVHEILQIGNPWHKNKIVRWLKKLVRR